MDTVVVTSYESVVLFIVADSGEVERVTAFRTAGYYVG